MPEKPEHSRSYLASIVLGAALVLATLAVYWPVVGDEFLNCDDGFYVTSNASVQDGLSWQSVKWAFTSLYAANWHPLTWLSHALDCQLFGLSPAGHHLTNLLFHAADTLLVFLVFRRLTGAEGRSFFVAALFGLHPLHVESVAWVSERKDVLSTMFFLLTIWAYGAYVESGKRKAESGKFWGGGAAPTRDRGRLPPYLLSVFFFACGLMSKPMLVTTPFVLLLLDYWPLGRLKFSGLNPNSAAPKPPAEASLNPNRSGSAEASPYKLLTEIFGRRRSAALPILVEKAPFFALSMAACVVTVLAQKSGGATSALPDLSLVDKLENAVVSYSRYLGKLVCPITFALCIPIRTIGRWKPW